ncbi:MAG: phage portal protein, partial [Kurthia sp.]
KAIDSENKMRSSLQYQMKVLCSAWSLLGICDAEDYLNIWFGFKRNLPNNITDAAQATVALKGNVSERTRLSLLPFVDDVEAELEAMRQDREEFADILMPLNALRSNEVLKDLDEETGGSGSGKEENGTASKEVVCPDCLGSGEVISDATGNLITCKKCRGKGQVRASNV